MRLHAIAAALALLVAAGPATPGAAAPVPLDRPVDGPVVLPFHAPARYGAGHRGVDLAAVPGTPVRAAASGRVTFAGRVVGVTWVTVDHGPLRTTTGPMQQVHVHRGQPVGRGQVIGTSGRAHGEAAVHWSARRGDEYVDPLAGRPRVATLLPDVPEARDEPVPWPRGRAR